MIEARTTDEWTCVSPLATRPVLYTDTVGGKQTCRDDLWAVTTAELNEIEALKAQPAWRPIATAPRDGRNLIIGHPTTSPVFARWNRGVEQWIDENEAWRDPTHWMPSPEPPK